MPDGRNNGSFEKCFESNPPQFTAESDEYLVNLYEKIEK